MVPAVEGVIGHFAADSVEGSAFRVLFGEELAEAIVAALHFALDVFWGLVSAGFVHVDDVVEFVHVHGESAHLFRDFGFGLAESGHEFGHLDPDSAHVFGYAFEVDGIGVFGFGHY